MMSPVNTTTKILQRSGIKMEIPPYLDPDSQDDDPEDGVNYPDPDLCKWQKKCEQKNLIYFQLTQKTQI